MVTLPDARDAWEQTKASHAALSPVDVQFRELAQKDPELLGAGDDRTGAAALLRSPRQPWPLFISAQRSRELAEAAIAVSRLVRTIPERLFHNDVERLEGFYGLNAHRLRSALQPPNCIAEGLSRSDFIAGPSGFKCVEFNFGGNLGGFDNSVAARMALQTPAIRRFVAELGRPVRHRNTFRLLVRYALRQVLRARIAGTEVNAALLLRAPAEARAALSAFFIREYGAVLAAVGAPLHGQLFICGHEGLTARQKNLYRFGTRLHIVVEGDTGGVETAVLQCFKAGTVLLFNGPISSLLSDKRNLALLSEGAESDAFSAEETAVIARHIPWSRCLVRGVTRYQGERHDLERLALARRQDLVLKKARSYGGADVILGRETSAEEWEQVLRRSLSAGDWVVQEVVESHPYLFQHGEGCGVYRTVWGPFVFGSEFGGMFLRVQSEERSGIINAARGAFHASLLEVEDPLPAEQAAGSH